MLFIWWRRSCAPGTYIHSGYQQEVSYHSCCISDQLQFHDQISFQNPRQMFRSYLWVIHYWSPRWHYWFHTFRRTCVPKKSMPSCFGSLTDITLRVRTGPFLVPRARSGRVPTNEGVFTLALIPVSRGGERQHYEFWWGKPINEGEHGHPFFWCTNPGICAVSTKKTRWLVSLWGTGFPCSRDKLPSLATVILFFSLLTSVNEQNLTPLIRASHRALRFHFGNPNITERSIPVVLTAYVGGFLSSHFALHPTPMWESDLHTSTVHRQNKCLKLQGSLRG